MVALVSAPDFPADLYLDGLCRLGRSHPFPPSSMQLTASDQKLDGGKAWERGYKRRTEVQKRKQGNESMDTEVRKRQAKVSTEN